MTDTLEQSRLWEVAAECLFPADISIDMVRTLSHARRPKGSDDDLGPDSVWYEGPPFSPRRARR